MIVLIIITLVFFINCNSSNSSVGIDKKVTKWYKSYEWLNNLQLIPHESINQQEFSKQYHKNKVWWDEAFEFLKTNNLTNIKPGDYIIDTGNVIATVFEGAPKDIDQVNWEAHRNFNDLQYIIKGKVRMGISSIFSPDAIVEIPYVSQRDSEIFTVTGEKYYDAVPGTFFIFSPQEIHRPAIKVSGYNVIKKIVIKVRVP